MDLYEFSKVAIGFAAFISFVSIIVFALIMRIDGMAFSLTCFIAFSLICFIACVFVIFTFFNEKEGDGTDYVEVADCGEVTKTEFHKNFLSAPKHIIHSKGCETVFVHANKSNLNLSPGNSIQLKVKKKRLFVCQEEVCSKRIDLNGQHIKSEQIWKAWR